MTPLLSSFTTSLHSDLHPETTSDITTCETWWPSLSCKIKLVAVNFRLKSDELQVCSKALTGIYVELIS